MSNFDIVNIKKNKDMSGVSNEDLAYMAQQDLDEYRMECDWMCQNCKKTISYEESLEICGKKYIHSMKCNNIIVDELSLKKIKCRREMFLVHNENLDFNSLYFDELFARHVDIIKSEAMNHKNIDAAQDLFSLMMDSFIKVVGNFGRNKDNDDFTKTSKNWFTTFLRTSLHNRAYDADKTVNYQRRNPGITCAICGKKVGGKITSKHLLSEGHEVIWEKIFMELAENTMRDTGEISLWDKNSIDYRDRCISIGETIIGQMSTKKKKDFLMKESIRSYAEMFPGHPVRSQMLSTNTSISDDSDIEFGDIQIDKSDSGHEALVDNLKMLEYVAIIIDSLFPDKIDSDISNFFENDISEDRKKDIIAEILREKISYGDVSNTDLDKEIDGARPGLTDKLIKIIKNNRKIKSLINS